MRTQRIDCDYLFKTYLPGPIGTGRLGEHNVNDMR